RVLIEAVSPETLAEVERAARAFLSAQPTRAQTHVKNLGFLAGLLADVERDPARGFAVIERKRYDEVRPPDAPPSARLVAHHGGWTNVCRSASGLLQDGRFSGPGRP